VKNVTTKASVPKCCYLKNSTGNNNIFEVKGEGQPVDLPLLEKR
jgi:hypothetical protein